MERRKFTREFNLEAVRSMKERGVSYAQASDELGVHPITRLGEEVCGRCPTCLSWARPDEAREPGDRAVEAPGNVWDNAAMESFFSSLKTERVARKVYRTRDQAKADMFDYIKCLYNPKRRHSTIGYMSPREFEQKAGLL